MKVINFVGFEPVAKLGGFHFDWIGRFLGVVPNLEVAALTLRQQGWLVGCSAWMITLGFLQKSNIVELIMHVSVNVYYKETCEALLQNINGQFQF